MSGNLNRGHDARPGDWCYMEAKESRGFKKYEPELHFEAVEKAADDSRTWEKLTTQQRAVLRDYQGDVGKHWERVFAGRHKIASIFHHTATGQRVIARAGGGVAPTFVIEQIVHQWEEHQAAGNIPDVQRDAALDDMTEEAWALLVDAQEAEEAAAKR